MRILCRSQMILSREFFFLNEKSNSPGKQKGWNTEERDLDLSNQKHKIQYEYADCKVTVIEKRPEKHSFYTRE